ncbi:MAG TPA: NADH-quinone oxidoreductase subunit H, partial [Saprospiraceae bacterium]|nr:NADH-quinone oxidoreductase subunit H [Saprospiraceae bacterium]
MSPIIIKLIFVSIVFGISLFVAMYSTYAERKVAAFLQDRLGPNRAGPFGLLQPLADGVKLFFKEEFIPLKADRWLFLMGPGFFMITALMTSAVIPFGPDLKIGDT